MVQTKKSSFKIPRKKLESKICPEEGNSFQIPDGGWGWVVCFAGFMINFTYLGLIDSSGILLLGMIDLYSDAMSKTVIVGSLFMGISMCVGPFVLLLMMFHASHRQVIICGGIFSALSTSACFFVEEVEVLYITYGIISGCFVGVSHFAGSTIVGHYFKNKRTLAVGIANSGGGFGAFALNYLLERSISFYGMRGTFLLISGLLLNFLVYGALCRPLKSVNRKKMRNIALISVNVFQPETDLRFQPEEKITENEEETNVNNSVCTVEFGNSENGPRNMALTLASKCRYLRLAIFDPDIMKNSGMQLLLVIYFLRAVCEMILIYLPAKAVYVGLNREQGAFIMSIYGAVQAFSQIFVGILADLIHIPTSYILMSSLVSMSAIAVAFIYCHSFTSFLLCASLFAIGKGFSSALRIGLVASILGVKNLAKGYSPLCLLIGLSHIIYPIIAGALFDATQSFDAVFYFAGGCLFIAFVISGGLIYMQRKFKFYE